jgi:RNA polymerase subunit RPABC4/transcription elongation factor Spt4
LRLPNLTPENVLLIVAVYVGMILAAFWLAMIIWAYRDMRARSRDGLAQLLVAVMVALLNVPGLLIYLLLRPRETLAEAYERSLEEEALLQEIEEKPTCPGCSQRVQAEWQACPNCHTRLKKPCARCGKMLELSWNLCPYCTTPQGGYEAEVSVAPSRHVRPATMPEQWAPPAQTYERRSGRSGESLEFVDGEDY